MDCAPPSVPTDEQINEIFEIADKAGLAVGARNDVLEDVKQLTASKLAARWNSPSVVAARTIGGRQWRGYVGITARHTYFDVVRSERRRIKRQRIALDIPEPRPQRPGTNRQEDNPRSDIDLFLAQETVKDVIDEHLDGNERMVAYGLFVDGRSIADLAEELDRAPRTIRAYRQTAIRALRAAIRPQRPDDVGGEC